jgi:hypothetical protein
MLEVGRRGFITGLAALVAAPAVIRVAPLMKISTRFAPMYVPVNWLADALDELAITGGAMWRATPDGGRKFIPRHELEKHAWPHPLSDTWVNVNDYDPAYVRDWAKRLDDDDGWPRFTGGVGGGDWLQLPFAPLTEKT